MFGSGGKKRASLRGGGTAVRNPKLSAVAVASMTAKRPGLPPLQNGSQPDRAKLRISQRDVLFSLNVGRLRPKIVRHD